MLRTPPILHLDVLRTVLEHAERDTQLTLMRTCHALYHDGAKHILSVPAWIDRWYEDGIASFLEFMRAEDGRRRPLLIGLIIGSGEIRRQLAENLAEGIRQWSNIEYLELRSIDYFLSSHQDLTIALSTLRNVKHLEITHAEKRCCRLLERVEWRLVTAQLSFTAEDMDDMLSSRMHPAVLLKPSRTSLVELRCEFWEPDEWVPGLPVYPYVRELAMSGIWYPATREWVEHYPNLRNLSVFATPTDCLLIDDFQRAEFKGIHERNRNALLGRCWDKLDEVSATWTELYLLGLTCRVRHLRTGGPSWSLAYLAEALEYTQPVCLDIAMHRRDVSSYHSRLAEAAAFLQDVEELQIKLSFYSGDNERDIASEVKLAMVMLGVFVKLRVFVLHIDCRVMNIVPFKGPAPPTRAEKSLQELDRRALFQTVTEHAPTLSVLKLEMHGVRGVEWVSEEFNRKIVEA